MGLYTSDTFLSRVATLWWYSSRKDSTSASLDFLCYTIISNEI